MRTNQKYLLGVSIFFFLLGNAQKHDSLAQNSEKTKLISRLNSIANKQKQDVIRLKSLGYKEFIDDGINQKQLIGADENNHPLYYTTLNVEASKKIKADKLYSGSGLGLNISGNGIIIGQWDFSKPRINHDLLKDKITYLPTQNQTISRHSTHIAGTMIGKTGVEAQATGVAYGSTLKAYDWSNDSAEMQQEANLGVMIANNSYGYDPIYLQAYQFGKYNLTAQSWDNVMRESPYFQIVKAAGNARGINSSILPQLSEPTKLGYDLLEGAGIAKNVLVVGSVKDKEMTSDTDFEVSDFSSFGPTDDGRIKPDVVALGENIYSSIDTHNSAYGTYNGTSSASASVAAAIALLQEYNNYELGNDALLSSTVRAILIHTANDKGKGPTYQFGYGLVDIERAIKLLANHGTSTFVFNDIQLTQDAPTKLYVVASKFESQPLVATLAWTDPEGNFNSQDFVIDANNKSLINNLDIRIIKKDDAGGILKTYYPWSLGGMANKTADATRDGANNVDNIEKVEITNPDGLYQIIISNNGVLQGGSQMYSLTISGVSYCYTDDLVVLTREDDNITENTFFGGTDVRADKIKASNVIKTNTGYIRYTAKSSIELLPDANGGTKTVGFEAENGSNFYAYITPDCSSNINPVLLYRHQTNRPLNNVVSQPIVQKDAAKISLFPNPTVEEVTVKFKVEKASMVTVSVYDLHGNKLSTNTSSQTFPIGEYYKTVNTSRLPSGVYIVTVETNNYKESKKLIIK